MNAVLVGMFHMTTSHGPFEGTVKPVHAYYYNTQYIVVTPFTYIAITNAIYVLMFHND